jgi:hypothetical protein
MQGGRWGAALGLLGSARQGGLAPLTPRSDLSMSEVAVTGGEPENSVQGTHTHTGSAALPDRSRPAMPCGIALCGAVTAASHSGKTRDSRQEMQAHTCREAVESRQRSLRSVVPASRAHPVAPQPAATPGERPSRAMTSPRWPAEETLGSSTRR